MIYLKPVGGLCNRLRAIDSLISICKIRRRALTVLWVNDFSLNCSFNEIFDTPVFEEFDFKIIDCPEGFPEQYMDTYSAMNLSSEGRPILDNKFMRNLKHFFKGNFLNNNHNEIIRAFNEFDRTSIISNDFLTDLYAIENVTVREMDAKFIPVAKTIYEPLFENNDIAYISSCYRIHPLENPYLSFNLLQEIKDKIAAITSGFDETIGLHIRRSDHETSKAFSSTNRFMEIMDSELKENSKSTFFISTDDEATKKELILKYGKKVISNDVSSYNRNNKGAIVDAVVDLYCLSKTKKIYGSHHSTFSQTAADIGIIEEITAK